MNAESLFSPAGLPATLKIVLLLSVLSLVPSVLVLTTCFVRIVVVLGLLRQALTAQQFLPNQVLTGLSLFLTAMVMWPVWQQAYEQGIRPYAAGVYESDAARRDAYAVAMEDTLRPVRQFMSAQIEATGNEAAIDLLLEYRQGEAAAEAAHPQFYEDVPLSVLLPAYVLSELKTAFVIGFQICLPFLIIDLVVASLLSSMGLGSVPPGLAALPFKLLLFVLVDGWFLTVKLLLDSVAAVG
jgi:flagellar biosynthetic protein FliP